MADPITTGRQIYDYFIARGLSPHQAAAYAGNMAYESGGNPAASAIFSRQRMNAEYAPCHAPCEQSSPINPPCVEWAAARAVEP